MADEERDSAKKETWQDWQMPGLGSPDLLTRNQLLVTLERLGLEADERRLRFWESEGVLPAPVRQRYQGATRAVYPTWYVNLVFALRHFQDRGYALKELPARMRLLGQYFSYLEEMSLPPEGDVEERWRTEEPPIYPFGSRSALDDWEAHFAQMVRPALLRILLPFAKGFQQVNATPLVRADLTFYDDQGKALVFALPLREETRTDSE